jgi:hypothetical protein
VEQASITLGSSSVTSIALDLGHSRMPKLDNIRHRGEVKLSSRREESFMIRRIVKVACALAVAVATMLATALATALPASAHTGTPPTGTRSLAALLAKR